MEPNLILDPSTFNFNNTGLCVFTAFSTIILKLEQSFVLTLNSPLTLFKYFVYGNFSFEHAIVACILK